MSDSLILDIVCVEGRVVVLNMYNGYISDNIVLLKGFFNDFQ